MHWQHTETIDAPIQRVWDLTVDVESWPSFTSTMQSVERLDAGPIQIGSSARIKQPGQSPAVWTVTSLVPGKEFTWQTRRLGLTMTGSHRIDDAGDGCRNTLMLDVTGPGTRLFRLLLGALLRRSLATENAGFKARAEQSS